MATINISLPEPMNAWIEIRLQEGNFSNMSDYVRHLIHLDQVRVQATNALQQVIDEGVKSGAAEPFDFKAFKAHKRGSANIG